MSEDPYKDALSAIREAKAYLRWVLRNNWWVDLAEEFPESGGNTPVKATTPLDTAAPKVETICAVAGATNITTENTGKVSELDHLAKVVQVCRKCRLGYSRQQAVFGVGSPDADLMFIGEAPGASEDKTGEPFVGRAGKVLTGELEKNGVKRADVFIANIIKCRPPDNRDPLPDEIESCVPYLHQQIEMIKPKMLCGLGRYACSVLMGEAIKIMQIRGTWSQYHGLPLFICLHPSAVLHQPNNRGLFDADIAALAARYHAERKV